MLIWDLIRNEPINVDVTARSLVERANDNCFIHKVHSGLRGDESAKHYEPVLLSIGPYHHGKPPLKDMEKHKIYYWPAHLDLKELENNATYIEALKNEKRRHTSYSLLRGHVRNGCRFFQNMHVT